MDTASGSRLSATQQTNKEKKTHCEMIWLGAHKSVVVILIIVAFVVVPVSAIEL